MAKQPEALSLKELLEIQKQSNTTVSKKVAEQLKALEQQEESIKKLNDNMSSTKGDGLNANVVKMVEEIKKSNKFLKKQYDAQEVLSKTGERREFKTIGQRIGGIKDNVKDFFSMRGFLDKTGIVKRGTGGIFSEALDAREDRQKYAKARIAAGDPTVRLHGEEGAQKIFERQRGEQQQLVRDKNKTEGKIAEYRDLNISERQIAKSPEVAELTNIAKKFEKVDPSVRTKKENIVDRSDNSNMVTSKDKAADFDMSESEMEMSKKTDDQTEILTKIEENTRAENIVDKPKEEGSKGGLLSGMMGGMKGLGGALSGAAKGLLALAGAVWIISKAMQNFASVKIGDFMMGIGAIAALTIAASQLKDSDASKTLLALGAALWITSKAFQNFAEVSFGDFLMGVGAIGALALAVKTLSGSSGGVAALLALGAAVWVVSKAFENFAALSWSDMMKGIVTIGLLGAGLAAMSLLAGPIAVTSAAFLVFGAALWVISKAFENVAESMPAFTDGLQRLADIGGASLISVAAGIVAVGAALAVFAGAQMIAAIGNLVSNFLSLGDDSPVEQLEKIGKAGAGIEKAATGLERLAKAMKEFGKIDEDALDAAVEAAEDIADAFENKNITINLGSDSAPAVATKPGAAPAVATKPISKASMTNDKPSISTSSESVSGTLSGVTGEQIQSHPNYKKYYDQAISEGANPMSAREEATMYVKEDMVKQQSVAKVTPPPAKANQVYGESAKVAAGKDKTALGQQNNTVVNAPTTVSKQTTQNFNKQNARNPEPSVQGYIQRRYAM